MSDRVRVLVSRRIPDRAVEMLRQHFDVDVNPEDRALNPEELKAHLKDKQGLLCQLQDQITGDLLNGAPQLKVSANVAVGYDNVDLGAATRHGEDARKDFDDCYTDLRG